MYVLEAMNGPLDGKRWEFDSSIVIGRDANAAQAALPVDRAVSRRHAQIEANGEKFSVVDLRSSNGTIVRGQAVERALLELEEPFVIGRTMLRILKV
jgi:pSer/pThr/pTyr-binding forkhead associated (FHA) protein